MPDMLVNLYQLQVKESVYSALEKEGIYIRRAVVPDKYEIVAWVKEHSSIHAAGECDVCFSRVPVSCFIATRYDEILGYACYNAIAPAFFGPTRVADIVRGKGIGSALLFSCMQALKNEGYVYAIIGGVGPEAFYKKTVQAMLIPNSDHSIYQNFLPRLKKE